MNFAKFRNKIKQLDRKYEKFHKPFDREKFLILFKQTCLRELLQLKYTNQMR